MISPNSDTDIFVRQIMHDLKRMANQSLTIHEYAYMYMLLNNANAYMHTYFSNA